MRSPRIRRRGSVAGLLSLLLVSFAMTGAASAAQWYFNGEALEGSEAMTNGRPPSFFTIPGLTFGCEPLPLEATIENSAGQGFAKVTGLPLGVCFTDSPLCTIEAFEGQSLPWKAHLTTVATKTYLAIEAVKVAVLFGGEECVLNETVAVITGSAGGLVENEDETIVFSPATMKATGTELKTFGQKVEWNATLELKATGPHRGEELSAH